MFGIEEISIRCLMTLSDGSKIQATITIPKPTKPIFPKEKKNVMDASLMSWIQIFLKMFVSVSSVRLASEKTERMFNSKE